MKIIRNQLQAGIFAPKIQRRSWEQLTFLPITVDGEWDLIVNRKNQLLGFILFPYRWVSFTRFAVINLLEHRAFNEMTNSPRGLIIHCT